MKARRRIRDAKITHVSLCKRGKNRLPVLFKSSQDGTDTVEVTPVVKYDEALGEMTAVVYAPEMPDGEGDVASAEAIRKMCHAWAENGSQVDINHDLKPLPRDKVFVAENFIVQKGDPRFENWTDLDGKPLNTEGAWAQIYKFNDPELKAAAAAGEIGGVSMYGVAEVEQLTKADLQFIADSVKEALRDATSAKLQTDEIEMDKTELQAMFDGLLAKVDEKIAAVVSKSKPETPEPKDSDDSGDQQTQLPFDGDVNDIEAVRKHAEKVRLSQLQKSVDWADPASVEKYAAELEKLRGDRVDEVEPRRAPASSRVAAHLGKADETYQLKGLATVDGTIGGVAVLDKADLEFLALGRQMAAELNEEISKERKALFAS